MQPKQNGNKKTSVARGKRDTFDMSTSDYDELNLPASVPLYEPEVHGPVEDPLDMLSLPRKGVDWRKMDDVGAVLFVCMLCNPLGVGENPVLRTYDNNSTLLRELPLDRADRNTQVYTCRVVVKPFETLRTRVAVKRSGEYACYEENVKRTHSYLFDGSAFRTYLCPASTDGVIFTAVVRDIFGSRFSRWSLNDICAKGTALRGWVGLLSWLVSHYGDISNLLPTELALAQVVPFAGDQVRPDRGMTLPLGDLLRTLCPEKSAAEPLSIGTLLQWMWLADLVAAKTQARLTVDRPTFAASEHLDVIDVYRSVIAVKSADFQRAAALFATRLAEANTAYSVAWAMLRLALSPSVQAEGVVRSSPMAAVPYLPLFLLPSVSTQTAAAVFSLFPSFRIFRGLQSGEFVLPAAVVTNICASAAYRMPLHDAEEAVAEYQALMHFVVSSDELLFKSLDTNKHLRVNSAALNTLNVQERAEVAVLPLVYRLAASPVPELYTVHQATLVAKRCRELRDFLQPNTLHADQQFVRSVYGILRALFPHSQVPGVPQAIADLTTVLPATNCAGLVHRFVAYLREDCEGLVKLEKDLFRNLCRKPENEPASMRKHFWDVLPKILKAHEAGKRLHNNLFIMFLETYFLILITCVVWLLLL